MSLINRLKRSKKARWIVGVWISFELISIPAAAMVAKQIDWPGADRPEISWVETDVPGEAMLVIRSDSPAQISISEAVGTVHIITAGQIHCADPGTSHPRIVHQSDGQGVIAFRFDPAHPPQIDVGKRFEVPVARACAATA